MIKRIFTVLALAVASQAATAGDVRLYQSGEIPDAGEVAQMLQPAPTLKFRSIRLLPGGKAAKQAVAPAPSAAPEAPRSFALQLQFGFDSHQLTPAIKRQLDAVAEGIQIAAPAKVLVEGHADASGSADYNMALSKKRALAVKRYLVNQHHLDPDVLVVTGEGENRPLNAENPFAAENRRVQFQAG